MGESPRAHRRKLMHLPVGHARQVACSAFIFERGVFRNPAVSVCQGPICRNSERLAIRIQ